MDMKEKMMYRAFPMGAVALGDDYMKNAFSLEVAYLLELDADRLLAGFRETAGLDMRGARRYDGWENMLIGGHTLGHYLTAVAQACVSADINESDQAALYEKLSYICRSLRECQEASYTAKNCKPGFIFGAVITDPDNVELQFDYVEARKTDIIKEAWVPWYTMHKIIAGLVDAYKLTGNEDALAVASGLGDWAYRRASGWDENTHRTVISIEYGGMNDCLYELYMITKKPEHKIAAHYFDETPLFELVASGGENVLTRRHANTTIPKFVGALKRYVAIDSADENEDTSKYLDYARKFFDMVTTRHTYVTGGNSEWEHFGRDYVLDARRTNCNCETCNVYNMLKLARGLFMATGDVCFANYYENTFINSILSSQNPKTGMTTYFQPMATGYFKTYGDKFDKFWCCTGTGMENFTKLGDSIYFEGITDVPTVAVNMYLSSTLDWKSAGVKITQNVDTSGDGVIKSSFKVTTSGDVKRFAFRLRVPDWASGALQVRVNGDEYEAAALNGYMTVERDFACGDEVTLSLPCTVTAHGLPDNPEAFAFKYGPYLLSAELGTEDMETTWTGVRVRIPKEKRCSSERIPIPAGTKPEEFLKKEPGKLRFTLDTGAEGAPRLIFSPHYKRHDERYGIYWYFVH
jgi:DUF1680 family protein